jgi:transcriptional regulator with XRE-family HTH domain
MTLGEKLRTLRTARNWTQPEAADAIQVEQSYLSKLENNHSVPSGDVLRRISGAYETSVAQIMGGLDDASLDQLRQIPDAVDFLSQRRSAIKTKLKRRTLTFIVLVALGASLIYAGNTRLFFPDTAYWYVSYGVIRVGESKDLFKPLKSPSTTATADQSPIPSALQGRRDERFTTLSGYRGEIFNISVQGGSRTYYLEQVNKIEPWQNKLVGFIGIFATVFGFLGLLSASSAQDRRERK